MRHLHPGAWFALCASLVFVCGTAGNVLVTAVVVVCAVAISAVRQGPRAAAFVAALWLGCFLAAVVLGMGLLVGPDSGQTSVLLDVPVLRLGAGAELGGVYTSYRLVASLTKALQVFALCAILGLAWQACPAGQWCDVADRLLGRWALILAPLLSLGEAASQARQAGYRGWRLGPAIVDRDLALVSSWQRHVRSPLPPISAVASMLAAVGAMASILLPLGVSAMGGLHLGRFHVSGVGLLGLLLLGFVLLRLIARRAPGHRTRIRLIDAAACVAAVAPVAAVLAAPYTGDRVHFQVPPDQWPGLPLITVAALLLCAAGVTMAQGAVRGQSSVYPAAGQERLHA